MSRISKFLIILFCLILIICCVYFGYQGYKKTEENNNAEQKEEETVSEADFYNEEIDHNIIIYDFITYIEENQFDKAYELITNDTKKSLFNNSVDEFKKVIQEKYYNNDRIVKNILVEEIDESKNIFNLLFQVDDTDDIGENFNDPLFTNNFIQVTVETQPDNTALLKLEFIEINKKLGE